MFGRTFLLPLLIFIAGLIIAGVQAYRQVLQNKATEQARCALLSEYALAKIKARMQIYEYGLREFPGALG